MSARTVFDITGASGGRAYVYGAGTTASVSEFTLNDSFVPTFAAGAPAVEPGQTAISLPVGMFDFRLLSLPLSDPDRVREVLPFELQNIIIKPTESILIDAVVLGPKGGEEHYVLAVYADKALVGRVLAGFGAAGIEPRLIISLELRHVLNASGRAHDSILGMLAEKPDMAQDDRPQLAAEESDSPTVNFRRGEYAYTRDIERTRNCIVIAVVLAALLVIVFAADMYMKSYSMKKEIKEIEAGIIELYAASFGGEKPASASGLSYKMQSNLKAMRAREDEFKGASPLPFMLELRKASLRGVLYDEINLDRDNVLLRGEAPKLQDVDSLKSKLSAIMSNVKVAESGQAASGRFSFTITGSATLSDGDKGAAPVGSGDEDD